MFSALLATLLPGAEGAVPPTAPFPTTSSESETGEPADAAEGESLTPDLSDDTADPAALFYTAPVPVPVPLPSPEMTVNASGDPGQTAAITVQAGPARAADAPEQAAAATVLDAAATAQAAVEAATAELELNSPKVEPREAPAPIQRPWSKPELAFAARLTEAGGEPDRPDGPARTQAPAPPPSSGQASRTAVAPVKNAAELAPRSPSAPQSSPAVVRKQAETSERRTEALPDSPAAARPAETALPVAADRVVAQAAVRETRVASASEPVQAESRPEPVRELSIKLPQPGAASGPRAEAVEVRVAERGGQVHVAVRTRDEGLSESLRANLPDLVARLETSGYRTESWHRAEPAQAPGAVSGPGESAQQQFRGSSDADPQAGSRQGQQGGNGEARQQQHRQQQQTAPEWVEALERSFDRHPQSVRSILNDVIR